MKKVFGRQFRPGPQIHDFWARLPNGGECPARRPSRLAHVDRLVCGGQIHLNAQVREAAPGSAGLDTTLVSGRIPPERVTIERLARVVAAAVVPRSAEGSRTSNCE